MTFQTKAEVNRFTRKLYRFLDDDHVVKFRHMRDLRGHIVTYTYPTQLHLDPRDNIISTLIHEALHYFYPEASESWVLRMESKIIHSLSERQVRNIIRRLAKNI